MTTTSRAIQAVQAVQAAGRKIFGRTVQAEPPSLAIERALEIAQREWAMERMADKSVTVYTSYLRRLDRDLRLCDPDEAALVRRLKDWREDLQERLDAREISASKIQGERGAMSAFYRALIKHGVRTSNPIDQVPGLPTPKGRPKAIPMTDQERICAQPDISTPRGLRDRAILECMRHGLRQSEFIRLSIGGVSYNETRRRVFLDFPTKAKATRARNRNIPLSPEGSVLFARYMLQFYAPQEQLRWLTRARDAQPDATPEEWLFVAFRRLLRQLTPRADEPVFRSSKGRRLYQVAINRLFQHYRDQAGVDSKWTPHSFRHRFCTRMLEAHVDPRATMRVTGHTDMRSLMIYTDVSEDLAVDAIDLLGTAPITESAPKPLPPKPDPLDPYGLGPSPMAAGAEVAHA